MARRATATHHCAQMDVRREAVPGYWGGLMGNISFVLGRWVLDCGEYASEICFCPMCGEKLTPPEATPNG